MGLCVVGKKGAIAMGLCKKAVGLCVVDKKGTKCCICCR